MKRRAFPIMLLIAVLLVPAGAAVAGPTVETAGLVPISSVLRQDVRGPGGTLLGAVTDLVLGHGETPTFLVLLRGSAFGIVGPYRLIPWTEAAPKVEKNKVVIAFDAKTIDGSPGVGMKEWPADVTPGYLDKVLAYYRQVRQGKTESSHL